MLASRNVAIPAIRAWFRTQRAVWSSSTPAIDAKRSSSACGAGGEGGRVEAGGLTISRRREGKQQGGRRVNDEMGCCGCAPRLPLLQSLVPSQEPSSLFSEAGSRFYLKKEGKSRV